MTRQDKSRRLLFTIGAVCLALSAVDLLWVYVKPVHATDYMQQFYEGVPYLLFGLLSALLAVALILFGWGWQRLGALAALFLAGFWILIAGASL